jgi:hypothetical protein
MTMTGNFYGHRALDVVVQSDAGIALLENRLDHQSSAQ